MKKRYRVTVSATVEIDEDKHDEYTGDKFHPSELALCATYVDKYTDEYFYESQNDWFKLMKYGKCTIEEVE